MKSRIISRRFIGFFLSAIPYLVFAFGIGCEDGQFMCDDDSINGSLPKKTWTIMFYGDGDNNLESYLLEDIEEMKDGIVDDGIYLIVLADRIPGETNSSSGFGENFTDTRLYRITSGKAKRISGKSQFPEITTISTDYEANMGDANTLQKFIQFCKANYQADHYALILWNHGSGPAKKKALSDNKQIMNTYSSNSPFKGICADETISSTDNNSDSDILYTAEISDVLTDEESVDLLGFDACVMGSVEVAYQYRPGNGGFSAQYMVASPANEWGYGWKYDDVLSRIKAGGTISTTDPNDVTGSGFEQDYDPATMTALQLGELIVEEQYDSTQKFAVSNEVLDIQTLSCYNLAYVEAVKDAVDAFAVSLYDGDEKDAFETIRGDYSSGAKGIFYFDDDGDYSDDVTYWIYIPFFDLYDLSEAASSDLSLSTSTRAYADTVMTSVDDMVEYSFGGDNYTDFINGVNGLFIFFPDGDQNLVGDVDNDGYDEIYREWVLQWFYNAIYTGNQAYYGELSWCIDSAVAGNSTVENWFEMLDAWFDYTVSDYPPDLGSGIRPYGGVNGYEW